MLLMKGTPIRKGKTSMMSVDIVKIEEIKDSKEEKNIKRDYALRCSQVEIVLCVLQWIWNRLMKGMICVRRKCSRLEREKMMEEVMN